MGPGVRCAHRRLVLSSCYAYDTGSVSLKRIAKIAYVAWMLGATSWLLYRYSGTGQWGQRPYVDFGIQVLDYTVPFDNYREHAGLLWLLSHRKIRPPHVPHDADPDKGEPWDLALDYVGYRPTDRAHPQRFSPIDFGHTDMIYITDTYGVYKDDLEHIDSRTAHMDYTPLVFGGLSEADVQTLSDFVAKGGQLLAEFNTFCDPTGDDSRRHLERVFGVQWTEWVGRVFADPYDTGDVPHWLPREFEHQYPGRELPHAPILLLIARDGTLELFEGPSLDEVAPRVEMTPEGRRRYPDAAGDAPYYFWFGIVKAQPETLVHAKLKFPALPGLAELLERIGAGLEPPALTVNTYEAGRGIYLVGDFADLDFDPGPYTSVDALRDGLRRLGPAGGISTAPVFWRFYAPVMDQLLVEGIERAGGGRLETQR